MPERPRMFLDTKTTDSASFVDLLVAEVAKDALGVSYFVLSIDPDPNALYQIIIAKILRQNELEITAVWTVELPHLTSGVYKGFEAGDAITVKHKSIVGTVKSGVSCAFNEVVQA